MWPSRVCLLPLFYIFSFLESTISFEPQNVLTKAISRWNLVHQSRSVELYSVSCLIDPPYSPGFDFFFFFRRNGWFKMLPFVLRFCYSDKGMHFQSILVFIQNCLIWTSLFSKCVWFAWPLISLCWVPRRHNYIKWSNNSAHHRLHSDYWWLPWATSLERKIITECWLLRVIIP